MLVCPTADEAAEAALKIVEATAESDLPAARAGLAIGPLLARGGDYFGLPVNMASRLVDRADPGTVLVDQSFMTLHRRFALEPLARIPLKIGGALLGGCDAKREPSEIRSARRPRQADPSLPQPPGSLEAVGLREWATSQENVDVVEGALPTLFPSSPIATTGADSARGMGCRPAPSWPPSWHLRLPG